MNKLNLLNKLEKLELDKKTMALIVFIFLLLFYIDFNFAVKLQLKGIKTLTPKIIKLKKDLNSLAKDLTVMQDLKNKQMEVRQSGTFQAKKIITREQIPQLLEDISDIANRNQVKINKINKVSPSKESKSEEEKIALDLVCDYHHLGSFINALENAEKFISIEEIKITPNTSDYFQQNIKLVLKTYVKK